MNYNLLYNAVIAARERKGAAICVKLDCHYDDMKFLPLEPKSGIKFGACMERSTSLFKGNNCFYKVCQGRIPIESS